MAIWLCMTLFKWEANRNVLIVLAHYFFKKKVVWAIFELEYLVPGNLVEKRETSWGASEKLFPFS